MLSITALTLLLGDRKEEHPVCNKRCAKNSRKSAFGTGLSWNNCRRWASETKADSSTGSARTAVGLFLSLVRRSGTHCPKTCGIWSVLSTVTVLQTVT